jgi:hypothetical protein
MLLCLSIYGNYIDCGSAMSRMVKGSQLGSEAAYKSFIFMEKHTKLSTYIGIAFSGRIGVQA